VDAFNNMLTMAPRFVGKTFSGTLVDMVGQWLQNPRPKQDKCIIAFEDACVEIKPESAAGKTKNVSNSIDNGSYFVIPFKLTEKAPTWAVDTLRLCMSIGFADTEAGWKQELIRGPGIHEPDHAPSAGAGVCRRWEFQVRTLIDGARRLFLVLQEFEDMWTSKGKSSIDKLFSIEVDNPITPTTLQEYDTWLHAASFPPVKPRAVTAFCGRRAS